MPTKSYSLENYRAFPDRTSIGIKPLTLVFGYNSAGKSALLRWLPLLRDSTNHTGPLPINLNSAALRGGTFADLISKFTSNPTISFSITEADFEVHYTIRNIPEKTKQIVERLQIRHSNGRVDFLEWFPSEKSDDQYRISSNGIESISDLFFDGLYPDQERTTDKSAVAISLISSRLLRRWSENIYWLQANRAIPKRKEAYTGSFREIAPDGEGITQLLVSEESGGSDVIQALSKWYETATGFRLSLQRGAFLSTELFSFCLAAAGQSIELADRNDTAVYSAR